MALSPSLLDLSDVRAAAVAVVDATGAQIPGFDGSRPATAATTSPAVTTTDSVVLAANAARRRFVINNTQSKKLYVQFGAAASPTSYTYVVAGGNVLDGVLNDYTGNIHAVWASGTGSILVTEIAS